MSSGQMCKFHTGQLCHTGHMWLGIIRHWGQGNTGGKATLKLQVQLFITVYTTYVRCGTNARCGGCTYARRSENRVFHPSELTLEGFLWFLANLWTPRLAMNAFPTHFSKVTWEKWPWTVEVADPRASRLRT